MGEFRSVVRNAADYGVFVDDDGSSSVVVIIFVRKSCVDDGY